MLSPAVSLLLVILTKSPGLAPTSFATGSVTAMYGKRPGVELKSFTTLSDSSRVSSSCFGMRKWVLILKAGTSSSTFLRLTVFLGAAVFGAMPSHPHR